MPAARKKSTYTVHVERDEDGFWFGSVAGLAGVHSQARTLKSLAERMREAIAAAGETPGELRMDYPKSVLAPVNAAAQARALAVRANAQAQEKMLTAIRKLKKSGLSLRDAAYLIGISFQRVQQLTGLADDS